MQQLNFIHKGRLEWREAPEPELQDASDVLVRPLAVARCDLECVFLFGDAPLRWLGLAASWHLAPAFLGKAPFQGPYPFGHECVAEVIARGEGVRQFKVGQKVVVPFQISCGQCPRCKSGLTGSCSSVPQLSMYGFGSFGGPWGGVLSDVVRVPYADHMLVSVPDGVDPVSLASASDNLPDAWRTVGPHLQQRPGAPVLIVGGGARSIGLYAAAIALALGSSRVDYMDRNPDRLALAESLGANPVESAKFRSPGSYAITVDSSARTAGLACALRSVEPGGTCTSVGIYFKKRTLIPLLHMYTKGVTFRTGRANARADIPKVLELVRDGRLKPERITTKTAPWSEATEALLDRSAKVVIVRPADDRVAPIRSKP